MDELPQIAIGSSEIEFLKGAEEYLCGTAYETTAEKCGVEEMIPALDDFLSAMPFLEEMKIAVFFERSLILRCIRNRTRENIHLL